MELDHPELPAFEPIVLKCFDFAHTTGIKFLRSKGFCVEDLKRNRSAHRQFIRSCHYGYDLAQRKIADHVIGLELNIRAKEDELREFRRRKCHDQVVSCTSLIRTMRQRQLTLRRLLDSILYSMISPQEWVLRHFSLSNEITRIDPEVLKHTVEVATERNRQDRMRFSIVADLTTPVQIGDLVEIDRSREPRSWKVVELKEGRMNDVLSSVIEARGSADLPGLCADVEASLGTKAAKQAKRMVIQHKRRTDLGNLATLECGTSPRFNLPTIAPGKTIETADYSRTLDRLCEEAKINGYGATRISECLHLVSISDEYLQTQSFAFVVHLFWHLANPEAECALHDPARSAAEVSGVNALDGIHDLVQVNLHSMWGTPMSLWATDSTFVSLASRKVKIFARLEFDNFVRLAKRHGIEITWHWGPRMEGFERFSKPIPGAPRNSWGALAKLPSGREVTCMSGFFGRIYVNLTTPLALIELLLSQPSTFRGHEIKPAVSR